MLFRNKREITAIIALFIFSNAIFLNFYNDVWWDSSVYIGMGKHILSGGKSGLWEESRPLILPSILGIGWALGFNVVYFGRITSIVFSVLSIFVVYKIGIRLFSKKTALLAAFFIAFSYTFLFFSSNILTEIHSAFFILLAFYFFIEERHFLMGLFSGIAVMTRIFHAFALIGLFLVFFVYYFRKQGFTKKIFYVALGALLLIAPYSLLNYYLYNDVLLPFKVQSHLTKTTGWELYKEGWFYFTGLLKENFFILALLFTPFFFKKDHKFYSLALIPLVYVIIFSFVKHKEMRYMIVVLPFIYLLVAHSLEQIYAKIKNKHIATEFFYVLVAFWLLMTFSAFRDGVSYQQQRDDEGLLYMQAYIKNQSGNIWVTNPLYALYSNNNIEGLLYFYSSDNLIQFIDKNKNEVDIVFFNECDIRCPPEELDSLCGESRKILSKVLSNFHKLQEKEANQCKYQIYKRSIS